MFCFVERRLEITILACATVFKIINNFVLILFSIINFLFSMRTASRIVIKLLKGVEN